MRGDSRAVQLELRPMLLDFRLVRDNSRTVRRELQPGARRMEISARDFRSLTSTSGVRRLSSEPCALDFGRFEALIEG